MSIIGRNPRLEIEGIKDDELSWLFSSWNIPSETTIRQLSPSEKLAPIDRGVKTPLMACWNRITQVGGKSRDSEKPSFTQFTSDKYNSPIAQAQPSSPKEISGDKDFSIFKYISNREYIEDKRWVHKDIYLTHMYRSLAIGKEAVIASKEGQVSPTESPRKQNSRLIYTQICNKVIMLDLDETLIRAEPFTSGKKYDHAINVKVGQGEKYFGIFVRPFTTEFLEIVARDHRVFVFTASVKEYAEKIVQHLDPQNKYIEHVLSRSHCIYVNGMFVKNLSVAVEYGTSLDDVIIVDNYVHSFALHPEHGIPIKPYYGAKEDSELNELANFLQKTSDHATLQDFMKAQFDFPKLYEFLESHSDILKFDD